MPGEILPSQQDPENITPTEEPTPTESSLSYLLSRKNEIIFTTGSLIASNLFAISAGISLGQGKYESALLAGMASALFLLGSVLNGTNLVLSSRFSRENE